MVAAVNRSSRKQPTTSSQQLASSNKKHAALTHPNCQQPRASNSPFNHLSVNAPLRHRCTRRSSRWSGRRVAICFSALWSWTSPPHTRKNNVAHDTIGSRHIHRDPPLLVSAQVCKNEHHQGNRACKQKTQAGMKAGKQASKQSKQIKQSKQS